MLKCRERGNKERFAKASNSLAEADIPIYKHFFSKWNKKSG
jgi:hypothetical protein